MEITCLSPSSVSRGRFVDHAPFLAGILGEMMNVNAFAIGLEHFLHFFVDVLAAQLSAIALPY